MSFALPKFYPILDVTSLERRGIGILEAARELVSSGVEIVQFRHKGEFNRDAFELAVEVGKLVQAASGLYFVNDRVDIALMLGADGVHVGQDDLPPEAVRRVCGDRLLVGHSTHNETQLVAGDAKPVDYLALGPVFGTASKDNPDPTVGVEEFGRLAARTTKPLVAIGGVTRKNAQSVLNAGAASLAVISDWMDGDRATSIAQWRGL